MAQIQVNDLTFSYDGSADDVLREVTFSIDTDWKLGLIGRNGKGKTTLLNLFMGKYDYLGSIKTSTRFDYFPYQMSDSDLNKNAVDLIGVWKPQIEVWQVLIQMNELKMDPECLYRPFGTLSFGERTRVMLAVLFAAENEFLLIDEPTNHLDTEAHDIVKEYLASGNFSSWWENKEKKDSFQQAENVRHLKEIGKLKAAADKSSRWADKNENSKIGFDPVKEHDRSIATRAFIGAKTKKMQARVKNYERRIDREIQEKEGLLQDIEKVPDLKIEPLKFHKEVLVRANNLSLRYEGSDKELFSGLRFTVKRGERVILSGENGCGKSSILKAILQMRDYREQEPGSRLLISGDLYVASGMTISYVNQDTSFLTGPLRKYCKENGLDESLFLAVLRQLDLGREQFVKDMRDFSEGQKKKVLIAASLITPAHLYIWDEPLNYIDVFSRMQIENLILQYKPTMLLVEHDTRFQEKVASDIIKIGQAHYRDFV